MGVSQDESTTLIGPLENCVLFRFAVRKGILERVD
jgi:hypothetical protein